MRRSSNQYRVTPSRVCIWSNDGQQLLCTLIDGAPTYRHAFHNDYGDTYRFDFVYIKGRTDVICGEKAFAQHTPDLTEDLQRFVWDCGLDDIDIEQYLQTPKI